MTLCTEEEAAEKWCPMARSYIPPDPPEVTECINGTNRTADGDADYQCSCIGSRCMAWRWSVNTVTETESARVDQGYCGAFGKVDP